MRSRVPALVLIVVAAAAGLAIVVALAGDDRALVANSGAAPLRLAGTLKPGERACAAPVTPPESFARVRVWTSSVGLPAPDLELAVRPAAGGPALARAVAEGGYRGSGPRTVTTGRVPGRRSLRLCARNSGGTLIALLGEAPAAPADASVKNGKPLRRAIAYDLLRPEPRSGLPLVSTVFGRAALFRPAGVGEWTYWLLLVLVVLAVPALLARALSEAAETLGAHPAEPGASPETLGAHPAEPGASPEALGAHPAEPGASRSEVLGDPGRLAAEDVGAERERSEDDADGKH